VALVRFGSKADMAAHSSDVRFTPKSGQTQSWNVRFVPKADIDRPSRSPPVAAEMAAVRDPTCLGASHSELQNKVSRSQLERLRERQHAVETINDEPCTRLRCLNSAPTVDR